MIEQYRTAVWDQVCAVEVVIVNSNNNSQLKWKRASHFILKSVFNNQFSVFVVLHIYIIQSFDINVKACGMRM